MSQSADERYISKGFQRLVQRCIVRRQECRRLATVPRLAKSDSFIHY